MGICRIPGTVAAIVAWKLHNSSARSRIVLVGCEDVLLELPFLMQLEVSRSALENKVGI